MFLEHKGIVAQLVKSELSYAGDVKESLIIRQIARPSDANKELFDPKYGYDDDDDDVEEAPVKRIAPKRCGRTQPKIMKDGLRLFTEFLRDEGEEQGKQPLTAEAVYRILQVRTIMLSRACRLTGAFSTSPMKIARLWDSILSMLAQTGWWSLFFLSHRLLFARRCKLVQQHALRTT